MNGLAWSEDGPSESSVCRVSCESAAVTVSLLRTGNGTRLKLVSERSGRVSLLDATVLDALCSLTPERAIELVRQSTEAGAGSAPDGPLR
jgi:hypothetical protein